MTKVIVYHSGYGCDTGCCGHIVEMENEDGTERSSFEFDHPYAPVNVTREDRDRIYRDFAEEMVREEFGEEHVKDLAWDECEVVDD